MGVTERKVYKYRELMECMKRELYDLTDEPFLMFANRIGKVLKEEGIRHNLVGGVAVQSYLLNMLCKKHNASVQDLLLNHGVRVQDYVRSTDDIDLALLLDEQDDIDKIRRITAFVERLPFEEIDPHEQSVVEVRAARYGASRPTFRVYVDGRGSDQDVLAMNIGRGQKDALKNIENTWYSTFIEQSQSLMVSYNGKYALSVQVPRLEHLIATKVAASRAKDLMDNKNLADLAKDLRVSLDFSEMEAVLLPAHIDRYADFLHQHYPEHYRSSSVKF